jgi:esterase/lipase superfamily enzyme
MGGLETPSVWKFEFREIPSKHVVLLNVKQIPISTFLASLKQRISESDQKQAFIFVHGYNVTFEDAARRTAQIAYDLGFDGAPILYSWPSRGTYSGYMADEATVEWTVPHLKQFLEWVAANTEAGTVHLISHSMGGRALTAALSRLEGKHVKSQPVFNQIVLTAPDIDADVFVELARDIKIFGRQTTLYASSNDEALSASRTFHGGFRRAGESFPKVTTAPGIITIDASRAVTDFVGHSYYADNRSILSDIFNLLRTGGPPRFGLEHFVQEGGEYWAFRP